MSNIKAHKTNEEDEIDLKLYEKAMADFEKNPKTYSLDEVLLELGINDNL